MNTSTKFPPAQPLSLAAPEIHAVPDDGTAWINIYRILLRRSALIGGLILLICLLALPAILATHKVYYAGMRVLASPAPALSLTAGLDGRQVSFDLNSEVERILSRDVADAVIRQFDLDQREEFNRALESSDGLLHRMAASLRSALTGGGDVAAGDEDGADQVARAFAKVLSVTRPSGNNVISIGFVSRDPVLAAEVPQAVANTYIAQRTARWQSEIGETAGWLEKRLVFERAYVTQIRSDLEAFLRGEESGGGATEEAASNLLMAIQGRQADLAQQSFEITNNRRSIKEALENPESTALAEPSALVALRQDLKSEVRELERLTLVYGENHETVIRRMARVAEMRVDIHKALLAYDRALEQRDAAILVELERLAIGSEDAQKRLSAIQIATPRIKEQTELLQAREQSLADLEHRKQLLMSQARLAPVSLEVLTPATVPLDPLGPGRKIYLLGTALGALLISLLIAAIAELRDNGIRSHEQLTHLPQLSPVGLWSELTPEQRASMASDLGARATTPHAENLRDMLMLMESASGDRLPQVLTVCALREQDMTLPVAEWIAIEIAATGRQVQLIETSPPVVADITPDSPIEELHPQPRHGVMRRYLSDLARQCDEDISVALHEVIEDAEFEKVFTIVNAPPLLGPGAIRYLRLGGPVLVVLRWGHTPRNVVELAAGLLTKLSVPQAFSLIVGVIPGKHRRYGFTDRHTVAPSAHRQRASWHPDLRRRLGLDAFHPDSQQEDKG